MVAASFVVGAGDGVQINVPSDARMRGTDKVDPHSWPSEPTRGY